MGVSAARFFDTNDGRMLEQRFYRVHFEVNPRTPRYIVKPDVQAAVIRERARRVREIGHHLTTTFRDAQVGTVQRGLTLEDGSLAAPGNYLKLKIPPALPPNGGVRIRGPSPHPRRRGIRRSRRSR